MIFQHTLDAVLAHNKTQTSRIWKDYYAIGAINQWGDASPENDIKWIQSLNSSRTIYHIGQILSIQPGRGKRGVGQIKILHMAKRDLRTFTHEDALREGYLYDSEFVSIWHKMHGANYIALVFRFEVLDALS